MAANTHSTARPAVDLDALLLSQTVWKATRAPATMQAIGESTGHATLDDALPQRGWPKRALTELLLPLDGIGELTLLLPTLARLTQAGGIVVLVAPPYVPYAPAWQAAGVDLQHLEIVDADPRNALWAFEQCLRSAACSAVIGWPINADGPSLRRLQVAADSGDCLGFALRDRKHAANPSPAALRIEYVPTEVYRDADDAMAAPRDARIDIAHHAHRNSRLPAPMTRSLSLFSTAAADAGGGAVRSVRTQGESTHVEAASDGHASSATTWSERLPHGRPGGTPPGDHCVPRDPLRGSPPHSDPLRIDIHRDGLTDPSGTTHVDAWGLRALAASARAQRAGIEGFAGFAHGEADSRADRAARADRSTASGHWHVRKCRGGNLPLRGVALQQLN